LQRIKIKIIDPQLRKDIGIDYDDFNKLDLTKITCKCPHKDKFEKIFETELEDNDEAMCWTACRHTTLAAAKRQMKGAPTPDEEVANDFVEHSMKIIEQEIGEDLSQFKYSVKDWYQHLSSKKQKQIKPALLYYKGDTHTLSKYELKQLNNFKYTGILKEELQPPDGKPRNVCAIPQRTKFIMGPVTWALEDICAHKLNAYCGNKNLSEMEKMINNYLAQGFTKVVEGDGSAFDNTQDVSLKELDRRIYKKIIDKVYHVPKFDFLHAATALTKTMQIEEVIHGRRKVLLEYTVLGTVFSGDCDTTLMNTIRMAMYNRYVNDKAGLVYGKDYVCFSKGDDFTVMYKPYVDDDYINELYYRYFLHANPTPEQPDTRIYGLGQVLKFLTIDDASSLTFCSLRAWWRNENNDSIYLTRDPSKFFNLAKYSRKAKSYNYRQLAQYAFDQETALRTTYAGITIFDYMADQYHLLGEKILKRIKITKNELDKYNKIRMAQIQKDVAYKDEEMEKYLDQIEAENEECVTHDKIVTKIVGDYWDFMKQQAEQHDENLTKEDAEYISQQINNEFFPEYLKSMINERWAQ